VYPSAGTQGGVIEKGSGQKFDQHLTLQLGFTLLIDQPFQ